MNGDKMDGTSEKRDLNCLYIGHILPDSNNIYEKSLIRNLKQMVDNLDVVSESFIQTEKTLYFDDIKIYALKGTKNRVINEAVKFFKLFSYISKWYKKNKKSKKAILYLNMPLEVSLVCWFFKNILNVKTVNLIIDTALGNIHINSIGTWYASMRYRLSESLSKTMSANMALNSRVFKYLKLDKKPCLHTKIGHNLTEMNYRHHETKNEKKVIVYTGTFIDYDGTKELMEAMALLNPNEYELLMYGSGPYKDLVINCEERCKNVRFMGYLPNNEMKRVMEEADLLINPRINNKYTDVFGFPSKMIEYLLSGTPVLTTRFAAMPKEYEQFVYIIENQTGLGIANAIKEVFNKPESERAAQCKEAYEYIYHNNKYEDIVSEMVSFIYEI